MMRARLQPARATAILLTAATVNGLAPPFSRSSFRSGITRGLGKVPPFFNSAEKKMAKDIPRRHFSTKEGSQFPVSDRVLKTLDPCVVLMKTLISQYAHQWEKHGGIYSLAQGVVYWEPPSTTSDAITRSLKDPQSYALHTYCPDEGLPELRETLQKKLASENALDNHDVMITAGANQAYVNCALAYMSKGDQCVVFKPYYFNHVMAIQMSHGNEGLLIGPCDEHGIPDIDWLRAELESNKAIRVVTVVNPGNPTGVSLERGLLQKIVDLCGRHGVWLVLDCTYEHFDHVRANSLDGVPFPGFQEPHVVHIFSFSKGHALAGFRCGYVVISKDGELGQDAYQQMLKVQDTIAICCSRIGQVAAMGALDAGRSWVQEKVATLDAGRRAVLEALSPLEIIMGGSGAMYVMAKLPEGMDDQEVARQLVELYGVAVIPGSFCGFPGWLRVCYSNLPPEECQIAAERLAKGVLKLCGEGTSNHTKK